MVNLVKFQVVQGEALGGSRGSARSARVNSIQDFKTQQENFWKLI